MSPEANKKSSPDQEVVGSGKRRTLFAPHDYYGPTVSRGFVPGHGVERFGPGVKYPAIPGRWGKIPDREDDEMLLRTAREPIINLR